MFDSKAARQPASGQSVRIMTYNIHRWAAQDRQIHLDRLVEIIGMAQADIVGLNEVLHPVIAAGRARDVLAELAERLHMWYVFGPSGWVDHGPDWHGPQGNALLSRYPLRDVMNVPLPRLPTTRPRSLLGARLAAGPAAGLTAFVTHLDHAFEGTRLWQIQGLLAETARRGPHFVAGDFNTPGFTGPRTRRFTLPVLYWMRRAGYEDAFRARGEGAGRTFPAHAPLFRLDFLFFPRAWARGIRRAQTLDSASVFHASDHRPVVVEWAWPDGSRATS